MGDFQSSIDAVWEELKDAERGGELIDFAVWGHDLVLIGYRDIPAMDVIKRLAKTSGSELVMDSVLETLESGRWSYMEESIVHPPERLSSIRLAEIIESCGDVNPDLSGLARERLKMVRESVRHGRNEIAESVSVLNRRAVSEIAEGLIDSINNILEEK